MGLPNRKSSALTRFPIGLLSSWGMDSTGLCLLNPFRHAIKLRPRNSIPMHHALADIEVTVHDSRVHDIWLIVSGSSHSDTLLSPATPCCDFGPFSVLGTRAKQNIVYRWTKIPVMNGWCVVSRSACSVSLTRPLAIQAVVSRALSSHLFLATAEDARGP